MERTAHCSNVLVCGPPDSECVVLVSDHPTSELPAALFKESTRPTPRGPAELIITLCIAPCTRAAPEQILQWVSPEGSKSVVLGTESPQRWTFVLRIQSPPTPRTAVCRPLRMITLALVIGRGFTENSMPLRRPSAETLVLSTKIKHDPIGLALQTVAFRWMDDPSIAGGGTLGVWNRARLHS